MIEEGPPLERLMRRLAECPPEFLDAPRAGCGGTVHVAAVVSDLLRDLGGTPLTPAEAALYQPKDGPQARNWLGMVLIAAWLLHDEWFRERQRFAPLAGAFLAHGLDDLAALVKAPQLVADPDRREELARFSLKALELRPSGESDAQAQDRLTTLSSVERRRVIREAQAAERRAREIREAMARRAAEEAAAKYGRE